MIPSMGLINLLEHLTELRKTVYLLDYQFFIKRMQFRNSPMEEMCRGRYGGRGVELLCPSWVHCFPSTSTRSPAQKLSEALSFGLLWRLHYIGKVAYVIGCW